MGLGGNPVAFWLAVLGGLFLFSLVGALIVKVFTTKLPPWDKDEEADHPKALPIPTATTERAMDLMDERDTGPGLIGWLARALALAVVMLALIVGLPALCGALALWSLR